MFKIKLGQQIIAITNYFGLVGLSYFHRFSITILLKLSVFITIVP